MTQSQKLALEILLDWLGKTPTPTSMYILARDEHEDHLHSITRLLATCSGLQSASAQQYIAASWATLLGYYESGLRTAFHNENSDAEWTLSELTRTQRLRRLGPRQAYPSFCKAISRYPTEEAQVFHLCGGVKGARSHIERQAIISLHKRGQFEDTDPRLAAHLRNERLRIDSTLARLQCCPGIRPHGGILNRMCLDPVFCQRLWRSTFPQVYKEALQDAQQLPRRVFHPNLSDNNPPRLFISPFFTGNRERARGRRQESSDSEE